MSSTGGVVLLRLILIVILGLLSLGLLGGREGRVGLLRIEVDRSWVGEERELVEEGGFCAGASESAPHALASKQHPHCDLGKGYERTHCRSWCRWSWQGKGKGFEVGSSLDTPRSDSRWPEKYLRLCRLVRTNLPTIPP